VDLLYKARLCEASEFCFGQIMSSSRVVQSCRSGLFVVDTIRVQRVGDGKMILRQSEKARMQDARIIRTQEFSKHLTLKFKQRRVAQLPLP
jgi:hypothetical protein